VAAGLLAEPRIAEAVRRRVAILLPQQHQRHARPAQLAMYRGPIQLELTSSVQSRNAWTHSNMKVSGYDTERLAMRISVGRF
jgi:hypothetical protein